SGKELATVVTAALEAHPVETITSDRGSEFLYHEHIILNPDKKLQKLFIRVLIRRRDALCAPRACAARGILD
ncbi:MAG: hypothetical protein NC319_00570, partial [Butyricicoccus sp.]|nr:hypothetical protein [Butyricicoccus sp.]